MGSTSPRAGRRAFERRNVDTCCSSLSEQPCFCSSPLWTQIRWTLCKHQVAKAQQSHSLGPLLGHRAKRQAAPKNAKSRDFCDFRCVSVPVWCAVRRGCILLMLCSQFPDLGCGGSSKHGLQRPSSSCFCGVWCVVVVRIMFCWFVLVCLCLFHIYIYIYIYIHHGRIGIGRQKQNKKHGRI